MVAFQLADDPEKTRRGITALVLMFVLFVWNVAMQRATGLGESALGGDLESAAFRALIQVVWTVGGAGYLALWAMTVRPPTLMLRLVQTCLLPVSVLASLWIVPFIRQGPRVGDEVGLLWIAGFFVATALAYLTIRWAIARYLESKLGPDLDSTRLVRGYSALLLTRVPPQERADLFPFDIAMLVMQIALVHVGGKI